MNRSLKNCASTDIYFFICVFFDDFVYFEDYNRPVFSHDKVLSMTKIYLLS